VIRRHGTPAAGFLLALWLLVLAGCSPDSVPPDGSPLEGTKWRLTEWTLSSLNPADFTITTQFTDGQISGNSAVNSYTGPCQVGPDDAFSVGQLAVTEMAGPEPAMRAEGAYLTLLGQATSYQRVDGRLTLYDRGGNESLLFEAAADGA